MTPKQQPKTNLRKKQSNHTLILDVHKTKVVYPQTKLHKCLLKFGLHLTMFISGRKCRFVAMS